MSVLDIPSGGATSVKQMEDPAHRECRKRFEGEWVKIVQHYRIEFDHMIQRSRSSSNMRLAALLGYSSFLCCVVLAQDLQHKDTTSKEKLPILPAFLVLGFCVTCLACYSWTRPASQPEQKKNAVVIAAVVV